MEYLQHGTVELKGMNPSQRRRLLRKAHKHSKSVPTEILMLLYCENNCGTSLCLVEEDIPRFLNAAQHSYAWDVSWSERINNLIEQNIYI